MRGQSVRRLFAWCLVGVSVFGCGTGDPTPAGTPDVQSQAEIRMQPEVRVDTGTDLVSPPVICQAGVTKCAADVVLACSDDGTEWNEGEDCGEQGVCLAGECCLPDCAGKDCGDDGCGEKCGFCTGLLTSCEAGMCICWPDCDGRVCGEDGCAGTCGECAGQQDACLEGQCHCQPDCDGKECGDDGCEGSCGGCHDEKECVGGECACVPKCEGKDCGDDGCDALCGDCPENHICDAAGLCECIPQCEGAECGDNGCEGVCGMCPGNQDECLEGACVCQPACEDKVCGDDGCGDVCGDCENVQESCVDGQCICAPYCGGKECGDDGCEGQCGDCDDGLSCTADQCKGGGCFNSLAIGCLIGGTCYQDGDNNPVNFCEDCDSVQNPYFFSKVDDGEICGPNGKCLNGKCKCEFEECLGTCCEVGDNCYFGTCCTPDCLGKQCGTDGCGGSCGTCDDALSCTEDLCVVDQCAHLVEPLWCAIGTECVQAGTTMKYYACQMCLPGFSQLDWTAVDDGQACGSGAFCGDGLCCDHVTHCIYKQCGSDGCGWNCGTCPPGHLCNNGQCQCTPSCDLKECGPDGCGGDCGDCGWGQVCVKGSCQAPPCEPTCDDNEFECGPDSCGGSCGSCIDGLACTKDGCENGQCVFNAGYSYCIIDNQCVVAGKTEPDNPCRTCNPKFSQAEYRPVQDGLPCGTGKLCLDGECCNHAANCQGVECGPDGCGATCGSCPPGQECEVGVCQ